MARQLARRFVGATACSGPDATIASMRIAYLVLSYTNPRQVVRLADRLLSNDPACHVVIHHDMARTTLDGHGLENRERVHLLAFARNARWGSFTIVRATLRSLQWISETLMPDWTVVISGQDYPVRPAEELHAKLGGSNADAFLTPGITVDSHRPTAAEGEATFWHARYYYRWYRLPQVTRGIRIKGAWRVRRLWGDLSLAQPFVYVWFLPSNGGTMLGFRRRRTPFDETFRCYGGSHWFAVNRDGAQTLIDFAMSRPDVVAYYARTVIPEESFINSVLMGDPHITVETPNLTYNRFALVGSPHPEMLTIADLDAIEESGAFFARKIDGSDEQLIGALDARLDERRALR